MAKSILERRIAFVKATAAMLGASVNMSKRNLWNVVVDNKHAGQIRYEPRINLWVATTGKESTVGDLAGCLQFVICRCRPGN